MMLGGFVRLVPAACIAGGIAARHEPGGIAAGMCVVALKATTHIDVSVFGPLKTFFNHETNQFMRTNPNKKISRYNTGTLIRNAWIRAATPANALGGLRGSGIYPLNSNALPDSIFAISDITLGRQNPGETREPDEAERGTSTTLPQTSSTLDLQPELVNGRENITVAGQNERTPPNPIPTPFDRVFPRLLIDPDDLEDISVVDIGDDTLAQFLDSIVEKETPSKILTQASPIPQIPLTMAKRVKQSADILNSSEKIKEKRNIAEWKKNLEKTKLNKRNKTDPTKGKGKLEKKIKEPKIKNKTKKLKYENQKIYIILVKKMMA